MRTRQGCDHAGLGRAVLGIALLGFGIENVLFGHHVVARAVKWPAAPSALVAIACVTAVVFLASGAAFLTERMGVFEALGISGVCLALVRRLGHAS